MRQRVGGRWGARRLIWPACDAMMLGLVPKSAPAPVRERVDRETCDNDPRAAISLFKIVRSYDQAAAMRAAGVPIWAINLNAFPTAAEVNRKHALSFDVILMEGVGHYPQVERPEEFQRHLHHVIELVTAPASRRD